CPWKVNIWVKKSKGYLEVTKFNDQHIGHECHPSASQFVPTLRKLSEEFLEEIRKSIPGEDDARMLLKRLLK
ncbi:4343_t:CDS:2, partial [Rhizophagus irregularis]